MSVEIIDFDLSPGSIDGLYVVTVKQVTDERGTIRELFRRSAFDGAGVTTLGPLAQINVTESVRGAIRGLHAEAMTKLVTLAGGEAFGQYVYCFDDEWRPGMPGVAVNPLDPALAIPWPIDVAPDDLAAVSAKDRSAPMFSALEGAS